MKHKHYACIGLIAIATFWGLLWAFGARTQSSNPPVNLDSTGARVSGVDGALVTNGTFTATVGSFSVGNLAPNDSDAPLDWDTRADRIGLTDITGEVRALAVDPKGYIYVGGDITVTVGNAIIRYFARWHPVEGWWSPNLTVNDGPVNALALTPNGTYLYIGGEFTSPNDYIGRWNITNSDAWSWSSLSASADGSVHALAASSDGGMYVGGAFNEIGDQSDVGGIVHHKGSSWSKLGGGVLWDETTPGTVYAIVVKGSDIIVGGDFWYVNSTGLQASHLARWDGTTWHPMTPYPLTHAQNIEALAIDDQNVYAASRYDQNEQGYGEGYRVFQLNQITGETATWTELYSSTISTDHVYALAASQKTLFVGGHFDTIGGLTTTASHVAQWHPNDGWAAMAGGVTGDAETVQALATQGPALLIGGDFTTAGGQPANRIARWVQPVADLVAFQRILPEDTVYAGETITYEYLVRHTGYHSATNVNLVATLPASVTFVRASDGQTPADRMLTYTLGSVAPHSVISKQVTVTVFPTLTAGTELTSVVNVSNDVYDPPESNQHILRASARTRATLSLTKHAPPEWDAGQVLSYTLVVYNHGPSWATEVQMTDHLPDGVDFNSVVESYAYTATGSTITWDLEDLAPNAMATVTLKAVPFVIGLVTNTAQARAPQAPHAVTATATTTITGTGGLLLNKTDHTNVIGLNETLTYTIKLVNSNSAPVANVVLTDTLPSGVALHTFTASVGTCDPGTLVCQLGTLGPAARVTVTLSVTPTSVGQLHNKVRVTGDGVSAVSASDDDTQVKNEADLRLTLAAPGSADLGQPFTYTLTALNHGPAASAAVTVTDDLPDGLFFQDANVASATAPQGTCTSSPAPLSARVTCTLGALPVGGRATVSITASAVVPGIFTNAPAISGDLPDPDATNNRASATTVVSAGAPQTRTLNGLSISAYFFADLGNGQTQAYGVMSLGEHFYLQGRNDTVLFDSDHLTGTGTLVLKTGDVPVFEGDFRAQSPGWDLLMDAGTSALPRLAGFPVNASTLHNMSLRTGHVTGATSALTMDPPDKTLTLSANFSLAPGPVFTATIPQTFTLTAGAFTIHAPAGATLTGSGIDGAIRATPISLELPAYFGGASISGVTLRVLRRWGSVQSSLELGGAIGGRFALPDLRFDNQTPLVLTDGLGRLIGGGGKYVIDIAKSRLIVNLPGNSDIIVPSDPDKTLDTVWLDEGQLEITLPPFTLNLANGELTIAQALLANAGVSVSQVVYQWPTNLGGQYRTLPGVSITPDGTLTLAGGGNITLPDILILGGETLRVNDPVGTMSETAQGYTFAINSGDVQIRLPQNDHTLALATGTVDVDGHFTGHMQQDAQTLTLATAQLTLHGLATPGALNDTDGLSTLPGAAAQRRVTDVAATQGTWQLPSDLGGGTRSFDAPIAIDGAGLTINDGAPVAFPDAILRGSDFPALDNTVTLEEGVDRTYKLNLAGTISVTIPGAAASTPANLALDSFGHFSGDADALSLQAGGLTLDIEDIDIENGQMHINQAWLAAPPGLGGDQIEVNGMAMLDADLGLVGFGTDEDGNLSAAVELPSLSLLGHDIFELKGRILPVDRLPFGNPDGVNDSYEVTGKALMVMPGFGTDLNPGASKPSGASTGTGVSCSGFMVNVKLILDIDGTPQLSVAPVMDIRSVQEINTPDGVAGTPGAPRMVDIDFALYCSIDIHELLISVGNPRGRVLWDNDQDMVGAGMGGTVQTMMSVLGHAVLSADVDMWSQASPTRQTLSMTGTLKVLDIFQQAQAHGEIQFERFTLVPYAPIIYPTSLEAEITIRQRPWIPPFYWLPIDGYGRFHLWTDWNPNNLELPQLSNFHFTAEATVEIGLNKGEVWEECVIGICISIPPMDLTLAGIHVELGEFYTPEETTWGLKGQLYLLNGLFETGMFIGVNGDIAFTNLDEYALLDSQQILRARQAWQEGRQLTTSDMEDIEAVELLSFAPKTVIRTVPISTPTDMAFMLTRSQAEPTLTLVSPSGTVITPTTTLSGVLYLETYTQTLDVYSNTVPMTQSTYVVHQAEAGDWQVVLNGAVTQDDAYVLGVLGGDPAPTLRDVRATSTGPTSAEVGWSLASDEVTTTLSLHITSGPTEGTYPITHTDGTTRFTTGTITRPLYTGQPIALDVPTPLNGAPATTTLDLSDLESGTYWIWAEANDGRNAPLRAYAPTPVTVDQSATWPITWTPSIVITPTYRDLHIDWTPLDHPDTDGYRVYVSAFPLTEVLAPEHTTVITTPWHETIVSSWLEPGRTYYIAVEAFDAENPRTVRSHQVTASPRAAQFTLTPSESVLTLKGGETTSTEVVLTRQDDVTPTVALRTQAVPDGLAVTFSSIQAQPTDDGTTIPLEIAANRTLPGGTYIVTLAAVGGGAEVTVDLAVTVQEPYFQLSAQPNSLTLMADQSAAITVQAIGYHGETDPIRLDVHNAPKGLLWRLSDDGVTPGGSVTLRITDTFLVENGRYTLHIIGDDGENRYDLPLILDVNEPQFALASVEARRWALRGESAVFPIQVNALYGWDKAVTLILDSATLPPNTDGGLATTAQVTTPGTPRDSLVVTPPETVYLHLTVGDTAPEDVYRITVNALGGALHTPAQRRAALQSNAQAETLYLEFWVLEPAEAETQCGIITGTHSFHPTVPVVIDVATPGTLDCITVKRVARSHLGATPALESDRPENSRYWTMTGEDSAGAPASGYTITLTLPTPFTPGSDSKICRYSGSGTSWTCAVSGFDAISNTLTRRDIVTLSEWAMGQRVGASGIGTDLRIDKQVAPSLVGPADALTYTLTYSNAGELIATSVVITDLVPTTEGFVPQRTYASGATATPRAGTPYVWDVADLAPSAGGTIHIIGQIAPTTSGVFSLTNQAVITTTNPEDTPSDTVATAANSVDAVPPETPTLRSPTDGTTLNTTQTTVKWRSVAGAAGYTLNVNGTLHDVGNVTMDTVGPLADSVYTWTVAAYDRAGNLSPYAAPWTFVVQTTASAQPVAVADVYTTAEDTVLSVPAQRGLLANDTDPHAKPLVVLLETPPTQGELTLNANGSFTYTPPLNAYGQVPFTYRAHNGLQISPSTLVQINVTPVNDAPVAVRDQYSLDNLTPAAPVVTVDAANGVLNNDKDVENDPLTAVLATGPQYGDLTLYGTGAFIYTRTTWTKVDFQVDHFTYRAYDGELYSDEVMVQLGNVLYLPLILRMP